MVKLSAVFLILAVAISLTACGNDEKTAKRETKTKNTVSITDQAELHEKFGCPKLAGEFVNEATDDVITFRTSAYGVLLLGNNGGSETIRINGKSKTYGDGATSVGYCADGFVFVERIKAGKESLVKIEKINNREIELTRQNSKGTKTVTFSKAIN